MVDSEIILKKNSALIQVHAKELTTIQRKLINALIYIIQKTGSFEDYTTKMSYIKELCKMDLLTSDFLKKSLKELADIKLEFNYLNKDKSERWSYMSLLSQVDVAPKENKIMFSFPSILRERLINPKIYAPIDIILIAGLKSSYAVILYEFLRDYLTSPSIPVISIKQFKDLMGVSEDEYKIFPNFKMRVLERAVNEINKKTDIACKYELVKEQNKYTQIRFMASKKESQETLNLFDETLEQKNLVNDDVLRTVPEKHRTRSIIELITKHLGKGTEYLISNIKYTMKNEPENFSAYLNMAFENDYAGHDREAEIKQKAKIEKVIKHKAAAEKKVIEGRAKTEKKLEIMRQLPEKEQERLRKRAITIIKAESPGNEFALSASLVEMKMADLHISDHEIEGYSSNDLD